MTAPAPSEKTSEVVLRQLRGRREYEACLELQRRTWGERFVECAPPALQMVAQKLGGVAAGAFDRDGRLLGFVFGLTGVCDGRLAHWSHMLAVAPEHRNRGLGRRLKLYQRELVLPLGVEAIFWTFDPLVAGNAHLNLNRLGVEVEEYIVNLYGDEPDNELARGIGTDRFVVAWRIAGAGEDGQARERAASRVGAEVRIEIPADLYRLLRELPKEAARWRQSTREAFCRHLEAGYAVVGFDRDPEGGRCFYRLAPAERARSGAP